LVEDDRIRIRDPSAHYCRGHGLCGFWRSLQFRGGASIPRKHSRSTWFSGVFDCRRLPWHRACKLFLWVYEISPHLCCVWRCSIWGWFCDHSHLFRLVHGYLACEPGMVSTVMKYNHQITLPDRSNKPIQLTPVRQGALLALRLLEQARVPEASRCS